MEVETEKLHNLFGPASRDVPMASILQIRTLSLERRLMRSLLRLFVLLLAVAGLVAAGFAQTAPEGTQGPQFTGGMAELQAHGLQGEITAISGSTITVKTEQGETYSVLTGPNTHFRKQREDIQITDLHAGDMIAAFGDRNPKAKTLGAAFVAVLDKARYEQMRAEFGKTWTAGVVQAIEGTNIKIKRPDNVIQTIAVDENTSFRRRREDITLLDIKPGDNVGARGSLQNGTFLATLVTVRPERRTHRGPDAGEAQPNH